MFKSLMLFLSIAMVLAGFLPAQNPPDDSDKVKERIIYVPYHQLQKLVQKQDTGIYLPYQDYRKLVDELERLRQRPPQLPTLVVISNVSYQGQVHGDFLEVQSEYHLDILKSGWHGVELGFKNIAIKEATLDGQPALLKLQKNSYQLVFKSERPEKRRLRMVFVVPIQRQHSLQATVQFHVPRAPIARLNLQIPLGEDEQKKSGMKVEVSPSILTNTKIAGKFIQVTALLGNTEQVKISWETQAQRKIEIQNIVHAENITRLEIGENFLQLHCQIIYDMIQGSMSQLQLKIPQGFRVFAVTSTRGVGIRDWTIASKTNTLLINLHSQLVDLGEGNTDLALLIKLEKISKKGETQFLLPAVEVLDVEREKGFYTIAINDLHTLKILERRDITQVDVNDLPTQVSRQGIQFAFKYLKRPFVLKLELEKIQPEYEVSANIYSYSDETLHKLYAYLHYDIKKSRIFGTRIEIPTGFILLDAQAYDCALRSKRERQRDRVKEYRERKENGKKFLEITFQKGIHSSRLFIRLHLRQKFAKEEKVREIDLPVFRVAGARREIGKIGIGVKSSFHITTIDKSQKNVFPLDPGELLTEARRMLPARKLPPQARVNIALRYFDHPIAARFRIEKRDPLVTAEVYNYIDVAENVLKYQFQIFYQVEYTGVKEFSFTLPKHYPGDSKREIASQVTKSRISDTANLIKEIKISAAEKGKNQVSYTIHTQREVLGQYQVNIAYEEKIGAIETSRRLPVFELITGNTRREHGFIIFLKNNNFSLDFDWKGLEVSDVNDPAFAKKGKKQGVLTLFKYSEHGFQLVMQLQKLSFEPVLNTVINRLHISTSVNKDFTTKNEAVVWLTNNRKQMLEFKVPEGSEVTSVARLQNLQIFNIRRNYRYQLDQGQISYNLRNEFYRHGYALSHNTRITRIDKGRKWIVVDYNHRYTYPIVNDNEKNRLHVYKIFSSHYRHPDAGEIDKYFKALTWSKSDSAWQFKVNIATNVQKDEPFILLIKYNCRVKKGEMEQHGQFALKPIDFIEVPVTYFTWDLGLATEYRYVWFHSNLMRTRYRQYGLWTVITPLLQTASLDTSVIDQDAEAGVVPMYPIKGKIFSFTRLNGGGYINVYYLDNNRFYALNLLAFLLPCLLIALLPKTKFVGRLSLVFTLAALFLMLSTINWQGYQDLYLSAFAGTLFAGTGAAVIRVFEVIGARLAVVSKPTPHRLIRTQPEKKSKETTADKQPKDDQKSETTD